MTGETRRERSDRLFRQSGRRMMVRDMVKRNERANARLGALESIIEGNRWPDARELAVAFIAAAAVMRRAGYPISARSMLTRSVAPSLARMERLP